MPHLPQNKTEKKQEKTRQITASKRDRIGLPL